MRVIVAWILSFRMACLRLDLTVHQYLEIWRNRPAIVVILEDRERQHQALIGRINEMYPF